MSGANTTKGALIGTVLGAALAPLTGGLSLGLGAAVGAGTGAAAGAATDATGGHLSVPGMSGSKSTAPVAPPVTPAPTPPPSVATTPTNPGGTTTVFAQNSDQVQAQIAKMQQMAKKSGQLSTVLSDRLGG